MTNYFHFEKYIFDERKHEKLIIQNNGIIKFDGQKTKIPKPAYLTKTPTYKSEKNYMPAASQKF